MVRTRVGALVVGMVLVLLPACGSDDESASERVCDARSQLSSDISDVFDDLRDANIGEAREELSQVRDSFDELRSAVRELGEEERSELQPDVDQLRDDVEQITDVRSLDELSDQLTTVRNDAEQIADQINDALDC